MKIHVLCIETPNKDDENDRLFCADEHDKHIAQFQCEPTIVGQRFAGNGQNVCPTTTWK